MVIDLQIKTDKNFKGMSPHHENNNNPETASEKIRRGSQGIAESPFVRTIEHSQIGEGLKHSEAKGGDDDEVVLFDKQELPHTAGGDVGGGNRDDIFGAPPEFDQDDRPTRSRRKKFDRGSDNKHNGMVALSPTRSLDGGAKMLRSGGESGRFESLILAKRIKNENSRMLQSLETRFSILQRNEQRLLNRIEGERHRAE